ncbi:MAG: HepT-like ribonuclease domain-containing protein [Thermoplasmatota archaeon]
MRNFLIHGYFDVDSDTVWKTVREDLPPLRDSLKSHLEARKKRRPVCRSACRRSEQPVEKCECKGCGGRDHGRSAHRPGRFFQSSKNPPSDLAVIDRGRPLAFSCR